MQIAEVETYFQCLCFLIQYICPLTLWISVVQDLVKVVYVDL